MEKYEVMYDDQRIAKELNTIFKKAIPTLDINENSFIINHNSHNIADSINDIYKYHPSIILIKEKVDNQNKFSFKQVSLCNIEKEIKDINPKNHQL